MEGGGGNELYPTFPLRLPVHAGASQWVWEMMRFVLRGGVGGEGVTNCTLPFPYCLPVHAGARQSVGLGRY
jgi:hypothetical protein